MWGQDSWGSFLWHGSPLVPLASPIGQIVLAVALLATGAWLLRRMGLPLARGAGAVLLIVAPLMAYAGTISMPHVFVNGTLADAGEVNANFQTLVVESNAQDARLTALETSAGPVTVGATSALQVTPATSYTQIPGLTATVISPGASRVVLSTSGGVQNAGVGSTSFAVVDVALFVDGNLVNAGGSRRIYAANTPGVNQIIANWSFGLSVPLGAGNHTIEVRASGVDPNASTAIVGGPANTQLQGTLTIGALDH